MLLSPTRLLCYAIPAASAASPRPKLVYPRAAVSCVLARVRPDPLYLLVKRGKAPGLGMWSLPGGSLELGESTLEGAVREVWEETGLPSKALFLHPLPITSTDAIYPSESGGYSFHYVISQVHAWVHEPHASCVVAGDDAVDACWFSVEEIEAMRQDELAGNVGEVVALARRLHAAGIIKPAS
mmetsp:Transcript_13157/g.27999  ORF Transcript_13157/g.27999 Transcript_13157/m.27999 type:complete len:183 (+) Transcript_13157:376-924(+)|eukprot:6201641-Pleurochrysis_carterae.AAC.4